MEVTDKFKTCSEAIISYDRDFNGDLENEVLETMLTSTLREEFIYSTTYDLNRELPIDNLFFHPNLGSVSHHDSRCHLLQDIYRYNFLAKYTQERMTFPKMDNYYASGIFNDYFRAQRRNNDATSKVSYTSNNGHYFNQYDPFQASKLKVQEATLIQTIPDNYYSYGGRTQQYHQVRDEVPPYLAY